MIDAVSVTPTKLHGELASLFVATRNDTARRFRELGVPLTVPETLTSVERDATDPSGWAELTKHRPSEYPG
jgi:hypothetical protein